MDGDLERRAPRERIRVGTAGWSYADWEGVVYPRRRPAGFHPLAHLARFFGCVEINSSFYALPNAEHARRWVELVADRPAFRFSAKLHQAFTHAPIGAGTHALESLASAFLAGLAPLHEAGALAALLAQFPHSFRDGAGARRRLDLVRELTAPWPLVLELRHASWFEREPLALLGRRGLALAAIDLPAAADHPPERYAPASFEGALGYLRLHGRNARTWFDRAAGRDQRYDYLYTPREVDALAERARALAAAHDETLVVANNHFSGQAAANALELLARLGSEPPLAPAELVEAFPRLAAQTRRAGQQSLF